ncbi:MAG: Hsp20/alpha crystallin family protein [Steroidobacteraceae bacterium]
MALFRYEPLRLVSQFQDEVNRVFAALSSPDGASGAAPTWSPPVDITEYADRFELAVDLPGVDPARVDITLEDGVLTLCGERNSLARLDAAAPAPDAADAAGKGAGANALDAAASVTARPPAAVRTLIERGHGRFQRRFVLPELVDAERVQASGRNGVLSITIPKQAKALPRKIKIAA